MVTTASITPGSSGFPNDLSRGCVSISRICLLPTRSPMKIIILGAGQVGGTLAANLASEHNDITVVDTDTERLNELQDRFDIRTVQGMASHPSVLRQAGCDDADMLIAVTNSDEINMVACQVAYSLHRTPTKIARVRSAQYLTKGGLFGNDAFPIDVIISPELVAVRAYFNGPLVGRELRYLRQHMPAVDTRVAAIFRRDRPIIPEGTTVIEADDEVFFIAAKNHIRAVMSELRGLEHNYKKII